MADIPSDGLVGSIGKPIPCPKCGGTTFEMRNYSMMWHDGDIHCAACGEFIRVFDAG